MSTFPFPQELIYLSVKISVLILAIALWFAVTASPAR
jgi:hypothetical protein